MPSLANFHSSYLASPSSRRKRFRSRIEGECGGAWRGRCWWSVAHLALHARRAAAAFSSKGIIFEPKAGDIILSNFSSWLDIVYAAINFNPAYLLPVVAPAAKSSTPFVKPSPARRRNAGASVVTETNEQRQAQTGGGTTQRFLGFERVSLWKAISHAGKTPLVYGQNATEYQDLSQLTKNANAPLLAFPELVTSNNRGILRMAPVFPPSWRDLYKVTGTLRMGKGQPELLIMSIRHEPPSCLTASTTLSVPNTVANPLRHVWALASSMSFAKGFQVRLLDPAESPTAAGYTADRTAGGAGNGEDALVEAVAALISALSRLRRTGLGWEDKEVFAELMRGGSRA